MKRLSNLYHQSRRGEEDILQPFLLARSKKKCRRYSPTFNISKVEEMSDRESTASAIAKVEELEVKKRVHEV